MSGIQSRPPPHSLQHLSDVHFTYTILTMSDHECACGLEECEANKSVSKE